MTRPLVLILVYLAIPAALFGQTEWTVGPDGPPVFDYASIQAAIDVAVDGDEILVAPGTYHESLEVKNKHVTLKSVAGAEQTVIDAYVNGTRQETCLHI